MRMENGIFIDLGHGGSDTGAVGKKYNEAMLVLDVGKELKALLKSSEVRFRFSRIEDKFLSLEKRCGLANEMKADIFLSIHINSAKNKNAFGTEAWVYSLKNNKTAVDFAAALTNDLTRVLNTDNRGVKENNKFTVLKGTKMSAILIELDFISNIVREQNIKDNVKAIAKCIYQNILELYNIPELPITDKRLYKVSIGAFENYDYAINCMNEAKAKGFKDSYII